MPSFKHTVMIVNEIKKIGFNSIFVTERIELPYYFYNLETKGILSAVSIKFKTLEQATKDINYLKQFNINYLFVIDNYSKIKNAEIYRIIKPLVNDRLVIVRSNKLNGLIKQSFGDLTIENNPNKLSKARKEDLKDYISLDLSYKSDYAINFCTFLKKNYVKASMHGLIGFYFSSLNNPKDGIFKDNIRKRANNSKIIIKYL